MATMQTLVVNPATANTPDGTLLTAAAAGRQNEQLVSSIHGELYAGAARGNVFSGHRTAMTIPVNTNNLVSVFSLYNPFGSGVDVELIETMLGIVLATTVVNHYGWYSQTVGGAVVVPTSQTEGTVRNGRIGSTGLPKAKFLTAATHAGTPNLEEIVATFGAVTTTAALSLSKRHVGLIVPQGTIISLAASTAASTASGMAAQVKWAEWPATA